MGRKKVNSSGPARVADHHQEKQSKQGPSKELLQILAYSQEVVDTFKSGRRNLKHEKTFVTEFQKMLTQSKIDARKAPTRKGDSPLHGKKQDRKTNGCLNISLTMKGGLKNISVAGSDEGHSRKSLKNALFRGTLSDNKLIDESTSYQNYITDVKKQTASAGFVDPETKELTNEGETYLREKMKVAKVLFSQNKPGDRLLQLSGVGEMRNRTQYNGPKLVTMDHIDAPELTKSKKEALEDAAVLKTSVLGSTQKDASIELEAQRAAHFFILEQPAGVLPHVDSTTYAPVECSASNANGMCIVRAKGDDGTKATSILYTNTQWDTIYTRLTEMLKREVFPYLE